MNRKKGYDQIIGSDEKWYKEINNRAGWILHY